MTKIPFHPLLVRGSAGVVDVCGQSRAAFGARAHGLAVDRAGRCSVAAPRRRRHLPEVRKAALLVSVLLLVWWLQVDDGSIGSGLSSGAT